MLHSKFRKLFLYKTPSAIINGRLNLLIAAWLAKNEVQDIHCLRVNISSKSGVRAVQWCR